MDKVFAQKIHKKKNANLHEMCSMSLVFREIKSKPLVC